MRKVLVAVALVLAACYSPSISSPGFYCHPDDNPACPSGQSCVGNRCVDVDNSVTVPVDMKSSNSDASVCKAKGVACSSATECCTFTCSPTDGCIDSTCKQIGISCTSAASCCSGNCTSNGVCAQAVTQCTQNGGACTSSAACCSMNCNIVGTSGSCAAASTTCGQSGATCTMDSQCCGMFCFTFDQGGDDTCF